MKGKRRKERIITQHINGLVSLRVSTPGFHPLDRSLVIKIVAPLKYRDHRKHIRKYPDWYSYNQLDIAIDNHYGLLKNIPT